MTLIDWFYLILWAFGGGYVGDVLGERKGKPTTGAIAGMLFGPLGWIAIWFGDGD